MFHLPVRGNGDGGIYTTVADISALWTAFFAGADRLAELGDRDGAAPQRRADGDARYGLGFWLDASSDVVMLEGFDAGVSF